MHMLLVRSYAKKLSFVLTVLSFLAVALPAGAEDKGVAIAFSFTAMGPDTLVGTYSLSGALNESGAAESTIAVRLGANGVPLLSADKVLHLAEGDIHLFVEGPFTVEGTELSLVGKWRLVGGTGAYADIKGHGRAAVLGDLATGAFSGTYLGKADVK